MKNICNLISDLVDYALSHKLVEECDRLYAINRILEKLGVSKEKAVYVGDSEVDCITAKNAGIPCRFPPTRDLPTESFLVRRIPLSLLLSKAIPIPRFKIPATRECRSLAENARRLSTKG